MEDPLALNPKLIPNHEAYNTASPRTILEAP